MNDQDIKSPQDFEAVLARRAVSRRAHLLRAAEGKSFPWSQRAMVVLALLMLTLGLIATAKTELGGVLLPTFMGTLLLLSGMVFRLEWQLSALGELLRRSEQRIAKLEETEKADP
jgi:hypothetical protein